MKVFAYCALEFEEVTRRAAGVEPLTCPPVTANSFDPHQLEGRDLVYFDLHGAPGGTCWLGYEWVVALCNRDLAGIDLSGVTVFAANCNLANSDSPMMDALLEAGARYVIAGEGPNEGPSAGRLYGTPLLGLWLRRFMLMGFEPLRALRLAKAFVSVDTLVGGDVARAAEDTLAFRAYVRNHPV